MPPTRYTSASAIINNVWDSIKFIKKFLSRSTSFFLLQGFSFLSLRDFPCSPSSAFERSNGVRARLTVNNDMLNLLVADTQPCMSSQLKWKHFHSAGVARSRFGIWWDSRTLTRLHGRPHRFNHNCSMICIKKKTIRSRKAEYKKS